MHLTGIKLTLTDDDADEMKINLFITTQTHHPGSYIYFVVKLSVACLFLEALLTKLFRSLFDCKYIEATQNLYIDNIIFLAAAKYTIIVYMFAKEEIEGKVCVSQIE